MLMPEPRSSWQTRAASPAPAEFARNGEAVRVDAEAASHHRGTAHCGDRVFDGGREGVFGSKPVADRQHRAATGRRELGADAVMRVEITRDQPTAVEEDDARSRRFARQRRKQPRFAGTAVQRQ